MTHIEKMKQWLEAMEYADACLKKQLTTKTKHEYAQDLLMDSGTSLRQAIAEAEKQEPVVWMYQDKSTHEVRFQKHMRSFVDHGATYETPLYTAPQPQRELNCVCGAVWEGDEMVCVPHKREWVGLTDEQKEALSQDAEGNPWAAVELAEAKLKELNT